MGTVAEMYSEAELALAAYANLSPSISGIAYTDALIDNGQGMSQSQAQKFAETWTVVDQFNDPVTGLSATIFQQGMQKYLAVRGTQDPMDFLADYYLWTGIPIGANPQYVVLKAKVTDWLGNGKLTTGFTVAGHSLGGYLAAGLLADFSSSISQAYLYNAPGNNSPVSVILQALGISNTPDAGRITNLRADAGISPIANLGINFAPPISIAIENQFASDVPNPPAARNHSQQVLTDALALYKLYAELSPALSIEQIGNAFRSASERNVFTLERSLDALRVYFEGETVQEAGKTSSENRNELYLKLYALQDSAGYRAMAGSAAMRVTGELSAAALSAQAKQDFGYFISLRYLLPIAFEGTSSAVIAANSALYARWQADRAKRIAGAVDLEFTDTYLADRAAMLASTNTARTQDSLTIASFTIAGATEYFDQATDLRVRAYNPAAGEFRKVYFGGDGADSLVGAGQADRLYGGSGNDTLTGGKGNEYLEGGAGTDTYIYNTGDGLDTILDVGGQGSIRMDNVILTGDGSKGDGRSFKWTDGNNKEHTYVFVNGNSTTGGDLLVDEKITIKNFKNGDLGITLAGQANPSDPTTTRYIFGDAAFQEFHLVLPVHALDGIPFVGGVPVADSPFGPANSVEIVGAEVASWTIDQYGNQVTLTVDYAYWREDETTGQFFRDPFKPIPGQNDTLDDTVGNDHIFGGGGNDQIDGTDHVQVSDGVTAYRTGGDDFMDGGDGDDQVYGGLGNDVLVGGIGNDFLVGGQGDDRIYADQEVSIEDAILNGNAQAGSVGGDWLSGDQDYLEPEGDDILVGGSGNDVIAGMGGQDLLIGGAGDDDIIGDNGFWGGSFGMAQPGDVLYAQMYATRPFLQPNNVLNVTTQGGSDVVYAGNGTDFVWGGVGDDVIFGEGGADRLVGESGNDTILGGNDDDVLWGDGGYNPGLVEGSDYLDGGAGDDIIYGGGGDDVLIGGSGSNILYGGAGNDTYIFERGSQNTVYDTGANTYRFGDGFDPSTLKLRTGSLLLDFGDGSEVHLANFDAQDPYATLSGAEFEFADGATLIVDELLARGIELEGTDQDDTLIGTASPENIHGHAGDDVLIGGGGNDSYFFNRGDGADTIVDHGNALPGGSNTLVFGVGIEPADVSVTLSPERQIRLDLGAGDRIDIGRDYDLAVQNVHFADGSVFSTGDFLDQRGIDQTGTADGDQLSGTMFTDRLQGLAGNDTLQGGAGGDALEGGTGNDTLIGGYGTDTYVYKLGDGADTLIDGRDPFTGEGNTLRFGAGIDADSIGAQWNGGTVTLDLGNGDSISTGSLIDLAVDKLKLRRSNWRAPSTRQEAFRHINTETQI